jgi:hypothetical protein
VSDLEPVGIFPYNGFITLGVFFPSNKVYWLTSTSDENLEEFSTSNVCVKNERGEWGDVVELKYTSGYSYYFLSTAIPGSRYNGWGALMVNVQVAQPQPQELEFFIQDTEDATNMDKKQLFELEGLIVDSKNGISEKNIDCMTAATYWRENGYPTIMTGDMKQVVILKNKESGIFFAIDVNEFYINAGNDSEDYPLEVYDFIGLYWKNGLFNINQPSP